MHMVSPDGLIPEAERIWIHKDKKSKTTHVDYHEDIDFKTYFGWWKEVAPYIPYRGVPVIDNCAFHNVREEGCPNSSSYKYEMQDWLIEQQIDFDPSSLKDELWKIILHHYKYVNPHYPIDAYLKKVRPDVTLLRQPQYHCELNVSEPV